MNSKIMISIHMATLEVLGHPLRKHNEDKQLKKERENGF